MEILNQIFSTSSGWAATVARLTVGLIMLPHGMQKMFGWYGGEGFTGTTNRFTEGMGYPSIIAFLIIFFEFFGAIGLIVGFASRFMAFGIIILMIGAIAQVHRHYGYFLNWHNTMEGEGMQFNLLMIGVAFVVMILGSGNLSVDSLIKF
ncbi:DoxX family protein [Aureibaculum sp. 2210JD6-5]|uniref:DoxX family protein n=1 Tax=Aureibaculum sp. 2210JD6-5 TaxID=3103957 RepID=UPI002AADA859|nr:DoxX family protein [Aureibaculum sp. 2210JD6-5]MDY7396085.1 DoxX family protein [Aureibaculum sp. 2210JD6-5]